MEKLVLDDPQDVFFHIVPSYPVASVFILNYEVDFHS